MTLFDCKTCLLINLRIKMMRLQYFLDTAIHLKNSYIIFIDHFIISANIFTEIKKLINRNLEL